MHARGATGVQGRALMVRGRRCRRAAPARGPCPLPGTSSRRARKVAPAGATDSCSAAPLAGSRGGWRSRALGRRPPRGRRSRGRARRIGLVLVEGVVELLLVQARGVERVAPLAVRQRQPGRGADVLAGDGRGPARRRARRGPGDHDVGPQAVDAEAGDTPAIVAARRRRRRHGEPSRAAAIEAAIKDSSEANRAVNACGVGVEGHPPAHDLGPGRRVARRDRLDGQAEPVEQLRP